MIIQLKDDRKTIIDLAEVSVIEKRKIGLDYSFSIVLKSGYLIDVVYSALPENDLQLAPHKKYEEDMQIIKVKIMLDK